MNEVRVTIDHELGHLAQDLLYILKNGYDDKYKNTEPDYGYGVQSKRLSGKNERKKDWITNKVDHPLRDVEFYTRLGDSFTKIKNYIQSLYPQHRKERFKISVGLSGNDPEYFFDVLKKKNPAKWAKAVKETYKALQDANVI